MQVQVVAVCCLLLGVSRAAFYGKKSGVVNLDASNFDKFVGADKDDVAFIEFYAPWCGHCKSLKPEYVRLAKSTKDIIKVFAVDASEENNRPLASRFEVKGFPTLKVWANGKIHDYNQERTTAPMKRFALSFLPSHVKKANVKNLQAYIDKDKDSLPRAIVLTKKSAVSATVKRLSSIGRGHIRFAQLSGDKKTLKKAADIIALDIADVGKQTTLAVFAKGSNESPQLFSGSPKSMRELVGFLSKFAPEMAAANGGSVDKLPTLLDQSCFTEHCSKKGLCVILIRGENAEDNEKSHNVLKEIEETSDEASLFAFSQIDGLEERPWIEALFGNMNSYYSNIVVLSPNKLRYAQYVGSFTTEAVSGWISGILTGSTPTSPCASKEMLPLSTDTESCKPKPKPKPKKKKAQGTKGPASPGAGSEFLLALDDSNLDDVVLKSGSPAIVEFYAPWCGHCKQLAPAYAKAADNLKGMVTFGAVNCDLDQNKALCGRFGIKGFPTLKTFAATAKTTVDAVDFMGARDARSIEKAAAQLLNKVKVDTVRELSALKEMLESGKAGVVFVSKKNKAPTMVRALAAKYGKDASVALASAKSVDEDFLSGLDLSEDSLPVVLEWTAGAKQPAVYKGSKTFKELNARVEALIAGEAEIEETDTLKTEL